MIFHFNTSVSKMYMRFLFSYLLVVCKLLIISIKRFCCLFISSIDFSIWFNFLVKVDSSCRLSKSPLAASITSSSIIMPSLPKGSRDPSGPGRLPCSLLDWLGRKMALLSEYIYYHDSKVLATLYTDRKNVTDFLYLVLHWACKVTCYYQLVSSVLFSVLRTSTNVLSKSKSRNCVTWIPNVTKLFLSV